MKIFLHGLYSERDTIKYDSYTCIGKSLRNNYVCCDNLKISENSV